MRVQQSILCFLFFIPLFLAAAPTPGTETATKDAKEGQGKEKEKEKEKEKGEEEKSEGEKGEDEKGEDEKAEDEKAEDEKAEDEKETVKLISNPKNPLDVTPENINNLILPVGIYHFKDKQGKIFLGKLKHVAPQFEPITKKDLEKLQKGKITLYFMKTESPKFIKAVFQTPPPPAEKSQLGEIEEVIKKSEENNEGEDEEKKEGEDEKNKEGEDEKNEEGKDKGNKEGEDGEKKEGKDEKIKEGKDKGGKK